jgi:hypothetical protein
MAQTRATSKALRSVLGFIAVLAGYADTPAAEMPSEPDAPPENLELKLRQAQASIHALKDKLKIPDEPYRELIMELFGEQSLDENGIPSSAMLTLLDRRKLYAEMRSRFK